MGQNVEITLDAKEAGAVRAWLAVQRAVDGYSASLGQVDEATAKNAKAAAEFDRAHAQAMNNAKRVLESLMTPQQKYQQSLESLASLHSRGLLSTEQYLAAMKKEKAALDAGDPAVQQEIQRKKQLEAAGRALTASTQTATERYRDSIARVNELRASGVISEQAYARAVRSAREELLSASGHVSKRVQAEEELSAELKRNSDLEAQRAAIAQRVLQSIQTPQQRYNLQLRELSLLRKENRLTEEQYAAAVRKSKAELDSATQSSSGWMKSVGTTVAAATAGYFSVSAAIGGIKTALDTVMESNRKFIEDGEKASQTYDRIFRQFRIQADLRGVQGGAAKNRILNIAESAGFSEEKATSAATALVSAGVSAEEASGGALEGFLNTLNAQGLRESDPQQFAESIAQYLNSQGMTVNTENMKMLGVQLQSLKETKVKLTDLPQLAQIGAGLKGKLSEQEQVAMFATLGDTLGSNIASTRMADIFKNLSVAGGKEDAKEQLKLAGLKPEDIDFHGEDLRTVMQRLNAALDKLKPEQQDILLAKVIEGGNISTFRLLQSEMPRIMQRAANLNDVATYEEDVAEGSSGVNAAMVRQQLRRNRILAERSTNGNLLGAELEQASLERGDAPVVQDAVKGAYDFARYLNVFGFSDDYAAQAASAAVNSQTYTGIVPSLFGTAASLGSGNFAGSAMGLWSGGRSALSVADAAAEETAKARDAATIRMASSLDNSLEIQKRQLAIDEERLRLERNGGNRPNTTPAAPVRSAARASAEGSP